MSDCPQSLRGNGFALVVTLALMVLLTLLAIGLLSLSTVALRSATQGEAMATARASKVALASSPGALAWAVLDEGTKARINTPYIDGANTSGAKTARLGAGERPGVEFITGLAGLERVMFEKSAPQATPLAKGITRLNFALAGESLAKGTQDALKIATHDITTQSVGLLTDVAHGGLKQDFQLLTNPAALPARYNGKGVYATLLGMKTAEVPSDPPWAALHQFCRLYRDKLTSVAGVPLLKTLTPTKWVAATTSADMRVEFVRVPFAMQLFRNGVAQSRGLEKTINAIEMDYESSTGLQDFIIGKGGTLRYPKTGTVRGFDMVEHATTAIKDLVKTKPFALLSVQAKSTSGARDVSNEDGRLATKPWCFAQPIGNAWAHPLISLTRLSEPRTGGNCLDHSFLLNLAFYDGFYFSGLADQAGPFGANARTAAVLAGDFAAGKPLDDPRLQLHRPDNRPASEFAGVVAKPDGPTRVAAWQWMEGAFNVNSTSVLAWKAMLGSIHDSQALVNQVMKSAVLPRRAPTLSPSAATARRATPRARSWPAPPAKPSSNAFPNGSMPPTRWRPPPAPYRARPTKPSAGASSSPRCAGSMPARFDPASSSLQMSPDAVSPWHDSASSKPFYL